MYSGRNSTNRNSRVETDALQNMGRVIYGGSSSSGIEDYLGRITISDESGESSCRRVARKSLIFPQKCAGADFEENSSVENYLAVCKQNIQAEV